MTAGSTVGASAAGARLAVCGGPYGNPYALRAFAADARARGCDHLYCLGDLGGFGAEVDALWPILTEQRITCVAGNYDVAIARADPDCGCGYRDARDNAYAQLVYDHTLLNTGRDFAAWMGGLPTQRRLQVAGLGVHLVHGSPLALNDFWWESLSEAEHRTRASASGADVILCTHSGLPWQRRVQDTLVVNVGVLGKPPNDGRPQVRYAVLDLADGHAAAEIVSLDYDHAAQAASMRTAALPEAFAETIETGWWTTCLESLPPAERARGRYHLYRSALPVAFAPTGGDWSDPVESADPADPAESADPADPEDSVVDARIAGSPLPTVRPREERPVIPLFGSAWFPSRLWLYTNFHCNLGCDYCAVASSPAATPRTLDPARFAELVAEAVDAGFTELYLTGGEPFLHPDITALLDLASSRLPTVVLTNAMLLRGARGRGLAGLAGRPLVVQTSLDGACAATHDRHRGTGSWARTVAGIRQLVDWGMPPRVALTETPENAAEVPAVAELLTGLGVPADRFAVRPLLHRGLSEAGLEIGEQTSIPELTVTTDGLHWHPAGADRTTSPDLHLAGPGTPLVEGIRRVTERFFTARLSDGSLPLPIHCAV